MRVLMRDNIRAEDGVTILSDGSTVEVSKEFGAWLVQRGAAEDIDAALALGRDFFTVKQVAALQAMADRPGLVKLDNTLRYRDSANVAGDTTFTYLHHIDVLPSEFPFFAGSWEMMFEAFFEAGTKGADQFANVTDGTTGRTIRVSVGIPVGDATTFANSTAINQPSANTLTIRTFKVVANGFGLPESSGGSAEFFNGGLGYPTSAASMGKSTFGFGVNGLRVIVATQFQAAAAGQIIKMRSAKLTLIPG